MIQHHTAVSVEELVNALEPLIRRIVREELARAVKKAPGIFYLEPDMPLYGDMVEIRERKMRKETVLFSHKEVWGE
jgi:hypothetical protein